MTMLAVGLTDCSAPTAEQIGFPPPADYKDTIKAYVRSNFFDPYSLRDVSLSEPQPGLWDFIRGWRVCLTANAKNRMGGYTGLSTTAFFFYRHDPHVDQITYSVDPSGAACSSGAYPAWPELDSGIAAPRSASK